MRKGNIYTAVPQSSPEEIFETLIDSGKVRIERIISDSNRSPEGFWYDQEESEWVMVLCGTAGLRFEGDQEILVLRPGDWVDIPAHLRHRVEWTDPGRKTVWLAVFYGSA
ncbi:MAG: cupin domain-containing protein [Deltaproteobacteria bacterium]|nr:cupin domain-containing protein [Deltaproteobacteria bacterium]